MPDPLWKAQQAFIRATRRGSKKHATPEEKLKLLDAAMTAIPAPRNHAIKKANLAAARRQAAAILRREADRANSTATAAT